MTGELPEVLTVLVILRSTPEMIDRIAPTHGRVIEGAANVERHRGWMHAALMREVER